MNDRAVLDASVLVPISLCDLLLRTAEMGLFVPRWTDEILRETRRGVARQLVRRGLDPARFMASVDRRIDDMQRAFPRASVTGWEPLVGRLVLPDPDDRHVLAAAVRSGAARLVSQNLRDFPSEAMPDQLRVVSADRFLLELLERSAIQVLGCVRAQADETGRHGKAALDLATVLARLSPEAPGFVAAVRSQLRSR